MWRPDLCRLNQAIFHDAGLEHPANQAEDSVVSNPLSQKPQQPLVIHRVEKAAYVGFYEVVDTLLLDGAAQCIEAWCGLRPGR